MFMDKLKAMELIHEDHSLMVSAYTSPAVGEILMDFWWGMEEFNRFNFL